MTKRTHFCQLTRRHRGTLQRFDVDDACDVAALGDAGAVGKRFGTDLSSKPDRRHGAAIIRWQYDQYGREVGTSMFDSSERPVPKRAQLEAANPANRH